MGGHLVERLAPRHEALARSDAAAEAVRRSGATPVRAELASLEARHPRFIHLGYAPELSVEEGTERPRRAARPG